MKKQQSGFTLVEIAIVLVIIGLLLGGVLKGQEMITNAKIRKVETDFRGVSAAFYTYQDRFNRIPGDDNQASTRFGDATLPDGNGNGVLQGTWNRTSGAYESNYVWRHMRAAGLVAGAGSDLPTHAYGGLIGIVGNETPHRTRMGTSRIWVCFGNISGDVASVIESRGDDGNPSTGSIIGVNTDVATYNLDDAYTLCMRM